MIALVLVALLALSGPAAAAGSESARGMFEQGLARYEAGDYDGAVEAFSRVAAEGVDDASVHYNLANSYFKSGRLGFAIYHYRRAQALAPRDADVAATQVRTEVFGKVVDEGLARAVDVAPGVRKALRDRAHINDRGAAARCLEQRQYGRGRIDQALDVGVDHRLFPDTPDPG